MNTRWQIVIALAAGLMAGCSAQSDKQFFGAESVDTAGKGMLTSESQADSQHTFDLLCEDQSKVSVRFRLDVQKMKWCINECQTVVSIYGINDNAIELSFEKLDTHDKYVARINRYTSQFSIRHLGYGDELAYWGQCKTESFSGFPARNF